MSARLRVLFVCGRARAARAVSAGEIAWASTICVMQRPQQRALEARFREELHGRSVRVLDIPDDYAPMDAELVELLRTSVPALLGLE